jgi:PAS domain S-box-containing protein
MAKQSARKRDIGQKDDVVQTRDASLTTSPISSPDEVIAALRVAIVESSDDAIVSKTLEGAITSWNPAAERMFGYTATEAVGRHISLIIPAEQFAEEGAVLARVRQGEKIASYATVTKDGREVEVSVSISPIRDATGRIIGTSMVARDISEQRRVESMRAQLAAIVESSDDAIVSKTLEGIITSWNPAAERMFGYSAAEAVGRHITLIIPPERHPEEDDVLARIRRGEKIDHFETVRRMKNGRDLDISLTVSPIRDGSGRIVGASKVARDISGWRRAEAERTERLREAESANRAKDEFLAMFGHELRNPLAAIASAAQVLNQVRTLEDIARPGLVIERQVAHLRRLVDDLLDAARMRTGKITLDRQPVTLADAVTRALAVLRSAEPSHHVIGFEVSEDVAVSADAVRLEQIILNLLTNAVKYTPAGRRIRVSVRAEGDDAVLRVRDQGVGMSAETLGQIFEMFVQGGQIAGRAQGGLGIGLSLARMLVELHGGTLAAASDGPGRGSEFTVRLPRITRPPAPLATLPRGSVSSPGRRILIVEDNDDARAMLRMLLESQGHEVFEAADGAEAIRVASTIRPDLAFIDLGLPLVDGYEVARQLRSQTDYRGRLVALTGYGRMEERCLAAGFDEYMVKPLEPGRLAEAIDHSR